MKKTVLLSLNTVEEQITEPQGLVLREPWVSQFPLPEEVLERRYVRRRDMEIILLRVLVVALLLEVAWTELILFGIVR